MKKVQKSKDSKEEIHALHATKWNQDKLPVDTDDDQQIHQTLAKVDASRDKRRISTKSSPDSRQRSHERICNSNSRAAAKNTNSTKRGAQIASKGTKQLNELMRPKRKLIQRGQMQAQRATKSQPNTRSARNATSQMERQTRLSSSANANQDIEEKNKNKNLPAAGHAVDFTIKRHARSHTKRTSRLVDSRDEYDNDAHGNGLGAVEADELDGDSQDQVLDSDKKLNVLGILSQNNYDSQNHHYRLNQHDLDGNNCKTNGKFDGNHFQMDTTQMQLAPTTVESKDILQQHQQFQQFMSMGSEQLQQTNLGLITPNIQSSTVKTLITTNNIRDIINQSSQLVGNQSILNSLQMQKDLGLGISAAANSLLKNTNIINQHNHLKRPLDRSNQKSKPQETVNDYQRSRSRSNRIGAKQNIQLAAPAANTFSDNDEKSSQEISHSSDQNYGPNPAQLKRQTKSWGPTDIGPQYGHDSVPSDAEIAMSNLNNYDGIMIGAKQTNDKYGNEKRCAGGVDIVMDGGAETTIGIKSTALRRNNNNIQGASQLVGTTTGKRSKDSQVKQKRNQNNDEATHKSSAIINSIDMGKNQRNKRITKQQTKEKAKDNTDQNNNGVASSGRQLRCHKQSGKKTNESKQVPSKQLPVKRRAVRTTKNTRDKSKDRAIDSNGCALFDEHQRKNETTVTILKQADDFAHAQKSKSQPGRGNSNLYATAAATLHKRQRRDYLQQVQDDQLYTSQSNSGDGDDQSSDFQIEREDKLASKERVLQSQVPLIGAQAASNLNAQKITIQNQIEQLINFGLTNGGPENSNSITDSDKNIEQEIGKFDAQYQSRLNQLPMTLGLSQLQAGSTQNNQLGLQAPQTQKDSANCVSTNNLLANLNTLSQIANVTKYFQLNKQVQTPGNLGGSTQMNQNLQSKSQLGFKTPVPIIGMGQHHKINYDDSDFNNATQLRKMPERSNSLQKKEQKNQGNVKCVKNNDQANNNLLTLFNDRERDRQQQVAKKVQTEIQIAQQNQAAQAAGLDELDPFTQRYKILKEVGRGAFGSVFKALDLKQAQNSKSQSTTDNFVAIKKLFYDRKYEQREVPMLVEIKNKRLNDNIIRLKDRYLKQYQEVNQKKPWQRIQKEYLFIVTDYLPHTICDLNVSPSIYLSPTSSDTAILPSNVSPQQMASAKAKCLESIRQVMNGVFKGLRDLHSIGITHRDIKLSNILLDNDRLPIQKVKICDLGSSKKLLSNPKDQSTQSLNYIGTRSFRAPELLVGNRYYDTKIDIWSAGVVFLKLLLGYLNKKSNLFNVSDSKGLAKVIVDQIGDPTDAELKEMLASNDLMSNSIKAGLSEQDILKKRFKKLDQQMKSQIPADAIDLLHKILQLSPIRRISAADALLHPYFMADTERKESVQKLSMINRTTETTSPCTNPNTMFFKNQSNQQN